jgi:hypothetical protein
MTDDTLDPAVVDVVARAVVRNRFERWGYLETLGEEGFPRFLESSLEMDQVGADMAAALTALSAAGALITPEIRAVVDAAREEAGLIRLVAAVVPGSMSRGPRAALLAAVNALEEEIEHGCG